MHLTKRRLYWVRGSPTEGNVAEICFDCSVSRLGDVVFVESEARGHCAVAPAHSAGCLVARRDIAKAEARGGCRQWGDVGGCLWYFEVDEGRRESGAFCLKGCHEIDWSPGF